MGFHAPESNASLPYRLSRTALGAERLRATRYASCDGTRVAPRPTVVDGAKSDHRGVGSPHPSHPTNPPALNS
jgi:hypothetical protein